MSETHRVVQREQCSWLKAALQPAMLAYFFMIPALWAALTAALIFENKRTLESAVQQGANLARLFEQNTTTMPDGSLNRASSWRA